MRTAPRRKVYPPVPLTEDYRLPRKLRRVLLIVTAIIIVALLFLFWRAKVAQHDAEDATGAAQQSASELGAANTALTKANAKLIKAGETPVTPTPPTPGAQGPVESTGLTGPRGAHGRQGPGPSAVQVSNAVASYCATGRCAGHGPTASQVASAVSTYCTRNGQCRGPVGQSGSQGVRGTDGRDGTDGTTGPPGPSPSPAMVQAAVVTYCDAHGNCQGPKGDPGPSGTPGTDGQDAFPFSFTFTVMGSNPAQPDTTYTVTCDSPGACTVSSG